MQGRGGAAGWPASAVQRIAARIGRAGPGEEITWDGTKALIRRAFPAVPQISVAELSAALGGRDAPVLIDVRNRGEYAVSHLPQARHAQGRALRKMMAEIGADRQVVLYCSVGYRSSRDAQALRRRGYANVSNLEGSIFEWANTGHPLLRGGSDSATATTQVHPFNDDWAVLLDPDRRSYAPG